MRLPKPGVHTSCSLFKTAFDELVLNLFSITLQMKCHIAALTLLAVTSLGCSGEKKDTSKFVHLTDRQRAEEITLRNAALPRPIEKTEKTLRRRNVVCHDHETECPDEHTCCINPSGGYGCCPVPNAVCCGDGVHCCPQGYACDFESGGCRQGKSLTQFAK